MDDIKIYVESSAGMMPLDELKPWNRCDDKDLWCDYEDVKPLEDAIDAKDKRIEKLEKIVWHYKWSEAMRWGTPSAEARKFADESIKE